MVGCCDLNGDIPIRRFPVLAGCGVFEGRFCLVSWAVHCYHIVLVPCLLGERSARVTSGGSKKRLEKGDPSLYDW